MKSTMVMHRIANPQRTTLAHLQDGAQLAPAVNARADADALPPRTANPRRTILTETEQMPVPRLP